MLVFVVSYMWVVDWCFTQVCTFSAISLREQYEQVTFWWYDDNVSFVLDHTAALDFSNAISLKQQQTSLHSDALSWFQAN